MSVPIIYALTGVSLFAIGLHALIAYAHLLRKILALNIISSAIFLILIALANRHTGGAAPDPVPHAMVLTGIVVSVSTTAVALTLARGVLTTTGLTHLSEDGSS
jgi:multicomponent Na+:H+ antiporter subunit C